jgi:uncharacterized membrane-anchored protein YitT (DUF2179 family)
MRKKILKRIIDFVVIALGGVVFALSVVLFLDPYNIVAGGITGVALLLFELFPMLPLGMMIIVLNIPIFAVSWRLLGNEFLIYSGFGILVASLLIDILGGIVPPVDTDPLLASLFGGLLMGLGIGIIFLKGATTGGTVMIARLLKIPFPSMNIGKLMMAIDGIIVIAAGVVFGSVNNMLFAIIAIYICSVAVDAILYGMNIERMALIISDKIPEIVKVISERLGRGATLLHGEGSDSGEERKIILCAVKRQQIAKLKTLIKEVDPKAFLILTEANEVLGEGFSDHDKTN